MGKVGNAIYWSEQVQRYLGNCGTRYTARFRGACWHIIGPGNHTVCQRQIPPKGIVAKSLYEGEKVCQLCSQGADPGRTARLSERWSRSFSSFKD